MGPAPYPTLAPPPGGGARGKRGQARASERGAGRGRRGKFFSSLIVTVVTQWRVTIPARGGGEVVFLVWLVIVHHVVSLPPLSPPRASLPRMYRRIPPPPSIGGIYSLVSWLMTIGIHPPLASVRSSNCFSMWPTLPLWLGPH
ncbi:hypothetical protein DSO57_1036488 [Entomophthora muscae]|uniref:Uncharacterized protein n=1 Tax=Entomophthora muscae TaxID=34485 RepID=A0ACC2U889_9FUNG|nr:hypothetical protein DSO57_1036488 [Entomophthora muscae]